MKTYRILATKTVETTTLADNLEQAGAWAKYECAREGKKLLSVEEYANSDLKPEKVLDSIPELPPGVPPIDLAALLLPDPVGGP